MAARIDRGWVARGDAPSFLLGVLRPEKHPFSFWALLPPASGGLSFLCFLFIHYVLLWWGVVGGVLVDLSLWGGLFCLTCGVCFFDLWVSAVGGVLSAGKSIPAS